MVLFEVHQVVFSLSETNWSILQPMKGHVYHFLTVLAILSLSAKQPFLLKTQEQSCLKVTHHHCHQVKLIAVHSWLISINKKINCLVRSQVMSLIVYVMSSGTHQDKQIKENESGKKREREYDGGQKHQPQQDKRLPSSVRTTAVCASRGSDCLVTHNAAV